MRKRAGGRGTLRSGSRLRTRISGRGALAILVVAAGVAAVAPFSATSPAQADTGTFSLAPIVGVRTSGPDLCEVGPASGTNCPATIVLNGTGLPTADPASIGLQVRGNASIVTVETNDNGSNGWLAGRETNTFTKCDVIVGASTSTQLIFQVGNLGATCLGLSRSISPGDSVKVTLYNPDNTVFNSQTTTAGTPPLLDPDVPLVTEVSPTHGPVSGGTTVEPGTGRVTVATTNVGTPLAAWFGLVATGDITRVDATHLSVVPPRSPAAQDNEGIAVQFADPVNGTSPQRCFPLLPNGCANQFFYLSENADTFTSPPLNFDWTAALATNASAASVACGISGSSGTSSGLTIGGSLRGGPVGVKAAYGISESALGVPEALVASATFTVENPIQISVSLQGTISACQQIPIPSLTIPGIIGFYFVVGGSITAAVTLTITINKGTYTLGGSFLPGSNPGTRGGVTVDANCVDADDKPTEQCVTTEFSASLTGTLAVSPLWLQIGPDFANVGAGLTASATGTITYPPLVVDGDICVAGNWVAQVNAGPLSGSTGGAWLGPYNIVGNGSLCPLGPVGGALTPTTTGLVSSGNPSAPGQEVTYTASVAPTPDGGTVAFTDGGTPIPTCEAVAVDATGNAPCAITYATAGSHPIVATYSGNTTFAGSASATLDQQVNATLTPTSTALVSSGNPSAPGQEVIYTATVAPTPDGGTVAFTDDGTPIPTCEAVAVDATGNAPCAITYASAGSHPIVATYSGNTTFAGSASTTLDQQVSATLTPTSTALASSGNPSAPGQEVTYTASVAPTPDGGTVSFTDNGTPIPTCEAVAVDATGNAPCAVTYATAGAHTIVATYSGNATFAGSASTTLDQQVNATLTPTSTALASSGNPSAPGQEVTYTASVAPTPDGGTVAFTDGGVPIPTCEAVAVDATGNAPCAVTYATAGAHPIVATYSGNTTFAGSTSTTLDQQVSAALTPTSTNLASSPNPSAPGQEVTYTATVAPAPDGGTVSFTDNGTPIPTCEAVAVDATGIAPCAVTYATAGAHTIVATYSGNTTFAGSTSTTLDQQVNATLTPTSTNLASSPNPSAPGQEVTYTATVAPTPDGGTVSFTDRGVPIPTCEAVAVDATGNAPCAVTHTTPGSHPIVATYSGTTTFAGSTSTTLDQQVSVPTAFTATADPTSAPYGDAVTLSASGLGAGAAGTVSFASGNTTLCVATVSAGAASCTTSNPLAPGEYQVTATYSEDPSTTATTSFTITRADPTVTAVTPSTGPIGGGQTITITGSNFIGVTTVTFGASNAASFTVVSTTEITAVTPAGAAGMVDVRVTTLSGTSAIGTAGRYTFLDTSTPRGDPPSTTPPGNQPPSSPPGSRESHPGTGGIDLRLVVLALGLIVIGSIIVSAGPPTRRRRTTRSTA